MKKSIMLSIVIVLLLSLSLGLFVSCAGKTGGIYYPSDDPDTPSPEDPGTSDNESEYGIKENPKIDTSIQDNINFSVDVHTANYSLFKNLVLGDNYYQRPQDLAKYVQIDQMLNYFDYNYETPEGDIPLALTSSIFDSSYSANKKILTVGLASKEISLDYTANNIILLVDTSGSMYSETKLGLAKKSILLMLENMSENDRISLVTYSGSAGTVFEGLPANSPEIAQKINSLRASGSTNGSGGIKLAYEIAKKHFIEDGNNRVVLMTDGDFNVGISDSNELAEFITTKRNDGIYLSCIGFGESYNYSISTMEALAKHGNGNWGYIHTMSDAQKLLVEELDSTLITIVKDVKSKIQFNKDVVKTFRLLGYENSILSDDEYEDNTTDAAEIGSGFNLTMSFEIELQDGIDLKTTDTEVAHIEMKYKLPGDTVESPSQELVLPIYSSSYRETLTENDIFVSCVIEFALIAIDSRYKEDASIESVISRLQALELQDKYKLEFLEVVMTYNSLFLS